MSSSLLPRCLRALLRPAAFDILDHLPRGRHAVVVSDRPGRGLPAVMASVSAGSLERGGGFIHVSGSGLPFVAESLQGVAWRSSRVRDLRLVSLLLPPEFGQPGFQYHADTLAVDPSLWMAANLKLYSHALKLHGNNPSLGDAIEQRLGVGVLLPALCHSNDVIRSLASSVLAELLAALERRIPTDDSVAPRVIVLDQCIMDAADVQMTLRLMRAAAARGVSVIIGLDSLSADCPQAFVDALDTEALLPLTLVSDLTKNADLVATRRDRADDDKAPSLRIAMADLRPITSH